MCSDIQFGSGKQRYTHLIADGQVVGEIAVLDIALPGVRVACWMRVEDKRARAVDGVGLDNGVERIGVNAAPEHLVDGQPDLSVNGQQIDRRVFQAWFSTQSRACAGASESVPMVCERRA